MPDPSRCWQTICSIECQRSKAAFFTTNRKPQTNLPRAPARPLYPALRTGALQSTYAEELSVYIEMDDEINVQVNTYLTCVLQKQASRWSQDRKPHYTPLPEFLWLSSRAKSSWTSTSNHPVGVRKESRGVDSRGVTLLE